MKFDCLQPIPYESDKHPICHYRLWAVKKGSKRVFCIDTKFYTDKGKKVVVKKGLRSIMKAVGNEVVFEGFLDQDGVFTIYDYMEKAKWDEHDKVKTHIQANDYHLHFRRNIVDYFDNNEKSKWVVIPPLREVRHEYFLHMLTDKLLAKGYDKFFLKKGLSSYYRELRLKKDIPFRQVVPFLSWTPTKPKIFKVIKVKRFQNAPEGEIYIVAELKGKKLKVQLESTKQKNIAWAKRDQLKGKKIKVKKLKHVEHADVAVTGVNTRKKHEAGEGFKRSYRYIYMGLVK